MAGESETFTKEQVDALVAERLAAETEGLKGNQKKLLDDLKAAQRTLKNYEGVDPEKAREALSKLEELEHKKAAAEGDFSKLREQMVAKHQSELDGRDKRVKKFESALTRRLTTDELRKALTGKALPEYQELLVEHGAKFLKVNETDDDFEYVIHDGKGNALVADGKGTPMTIDQFVDQTLKTKYPGAFAGSGSSGGGATRSTGGASGRAPAVIANTNSPEFLQNLDRIRKGEAKVGA